MLSSNRWVAFVIVAFFLIVVLSGCSNERDSSNEQGSDRYDAGHSDKDEQLETHAEDISEAGPPVATPELSPDQATSTEGASQFEASWQSEAPLLSEPPQSEERSKHQIEEAAIIEKKHELPLGFVYVDEVLQRAQYDIRYFGNNNFVGEQIDGYLSPLAILSEPAAASLRKAEQKLEPLGYAFLIYDAYRPQKAVEHFKIWMTDEQDTKMKQEFYPAIDKANIFKLGYLAQRSGHSRGSTVDLTLIDIETGEPLDMGGSYDLLDERSAHDAKDITPIQAEHRLLLKETMIAAGFKPYHKEWWHYTLKNEPYPKKYFDFDVE